MLSKITPNKNIVFKMIENLFAAEESTIEITID